MTVPFIQEIVPKYEFTNARTFLSLSRGVFLLVKNPERTSDFSNIKGEVVRIDGWLYRVLGVDRHSHCPPWHVGEEIGLQVEFVKMTAPFVKEIIQQGLQLDADRYRALRQKFKNHEVSLELWGEYYDNQATVVGPDELDTYLDTYIASQAASVVEPKEPEPVSMDAVWIKERDATAAQRLYATDQKHGFHEPEYLVQWTMLTDEQKQKAKP